MVQEIGEACKQIVRTLSEEGEQEAEMYCRDHLESDINPCTEEYSKIKSEAISETEIWGNEADKWYRILPASASEKETISEWRFVTGNFLLSSVTQCETNGSLENDVLASKAAHKMFKQLQKSKRNRSLSLSLYYNKMGHVAKKQRDFEDSLNLFETSVEIIKSNESLGGWHYEALFLRDFALAECKVKQEDGKFLDCIESIKQARDKIQKTESPKSEKFCKQLSAEEYRMRYKMAKEIGNIERSISYLKCSANLYNEGGRNDKAQDIIDKVRKIETNH